MLCKWHCSGVEPAVDNFRYTVHGLAAIRAGEGHGIDIWTVKLYFCRHLDHQHALRILHGFRWIPGVRTHIPRCLVEFPSNGYGRYPSPECSQASHRNVLFRWISGIQLTVLLLRIRSSFTSVILINHDSLA